MTMDFEKIWKEALVEIEPNISKANFATWFKDTCISKYDNGVAVVKVPNNFARDYLADKYYKFVFGALRNLIPNIRHIEYIIVQPPQEQAKKPLKKQANEEQMGFSELNMDTEANLNPKYTFDSFIVASFNEVAHAAALAVSKQLGSLYNPLFIYGGVGLGKTHLIQAIGNEIRKNNKNAKIQYITSEKFANDYINSIQNKTIQAFKEKYRKYNLLIVDDIQFFSDKLKIQEEFFHVFNALYDGSNQIVFSSDKPPQYVVGLEERLRSRFEGGMMVDVSQPSLEERMAILRIKMQQKFFNLPDELINYIAENINENIRELEGALNSVIGQSKIKGRILHLPEVEQIIKKKVKPIKIVTIDHIIKTISIYYNIEEKNLTEKTRRQEVVKPRQIAMYLIRDNLKISYPHIGKSLGQKDHTTAIHAVKKISGDIKKDKRLEQEINNLKDLIYKTGV
ncbi:chromosomal replication initiator protein DnaA [Candidatus Parcubacteria bacterium]|nr:MAG: chromosomal replication initiator protein DnaA [Candidatus Parcubacteria bacterium]